jgi:hypothetical protein
MDTAGRTAKIRKEVREALYAGTALVVIILAIAWWNTAPSSKSVVAAHEKAVTELVVPLTTRPFDKWPKIGMEPGGKSIIMPVMKLTRPVIRGSDFWITCVHEDGRKTELGLNDGGPCPGDDVAFQYVNNTKNITNHLSYAYQVTPASTR